MQIKSILEYAPTAARRAAIRKFRKLNSVNTFSRMIRPFDFVIGSAAVPSYPRLLRSSASREDSPCKLPSSIIFFLPFLLSGTLQAALFSRLSALSPFLFIRFILPRRSKDSDTER